LLDASAIALEELIENEAYRGSAKVGLVGSTGLLQSGLFQHKLEALGYQTVVLNEAEQEQYFMEPLYGKNGIKTGNIDDGILTRFSRLLHILAERGADVIIGACSEIPLVARKPMPVPFIDAFELLAVKAVKCCYSK
jgi:aspartate racemase